MWIMSGMTVLLCCCQVLAKVIKELNIQGGYMKISAVLYAIVIAAFFMPFFVVSCQKTELMKVSGIQLVTGADVKLSMGDMFSGMGKKADAEEQKQKINAQPMAGAALLIAVIALVLTLVLPRKLFIIPIIFSVAGVVCLQVLKSGMLGALSTADTGLDPSMDLSKILSIQAKLGFWLANVFFVMGGLLCLASRFMGKDESLEIPQTEFQHIPDLDSLDELEPLPTAVPLDDLEEAQPSSVQDLVEPEDTQEK